MRQAAASLQLAARVAVDSVVATVDAAASVGCCYLNRFGLIGCEVFIEFAVETPTCPVSASELAQRWTTPWSECKSKTKVELLLWLWLRSSLGAPCARVEKRVGSVFNLCYL